MAIKHARIKKKSRVWIRLAVVLGVAAVLGLVFIASVGVGKLLLNAAKQYPAELQQEQVSVPEQEIVPVRVPCTCIFPMKVKRISKRITKPQSKLPTSWWLAPTTGRDTR